MAVIDCAVAVGSFVGADALGAGAAAVAGGAIMGAGAGALYSGITGDGNILNSALNGALIGGGIGGIGGAVGLTGASGSLFGAPQAGALSGVGSSLFPAATGAVTPTVAAPIAASSIGSSAAPAIVDTTIPSVGATNAVTPSMVAAANATTDPIGAMGYMTSATPSELAAATGPGAQLAAPSFWDSGMGTAAKWGAGLMAANAIMNNDGKKYGTLSQSQVQSLPLQYQSNFGTYKPLDTSVMRPMGPAIGYTGTPYGAPGYVGSRIGYAAGGAIDGGLSDANPTQNPSVGPVEQMSRDNALGQNQMFPQANINSPAFSSATNTPMGTNMIAAAGDTNVDPYTGAERFADGGLLENIATMPIRQLEAAANNPEQALLGANTPFETSMWNGLLGTNYTPTTNMWGTPTDAAVAGDVSHRPQYAAQGGIMQGYAQGGVPNLGGYAAGGNPRLLKGPGDGMSDNIPAVIGQKQPARLADGEFVVPADVVSHLGNGSTDAGAKKLHSMMDNVRKARTGRKAQGKQIKADKFIPK